MKYFLIAGEPSGDMHAAELMKQIKAFDSNADFMFFGGDLMLEQGGQLITHYRDMAYMGILPVILHLNKIKQNFAVCKKHLLQFNPDMLILVDYPGFNLRIAKFAKTNNIKVSYYISPKIWAWKTKRVFKIKKYVDNMYTIFPFEIRFYEKYNYKVKYVGNPVYNMLKPLIDDKTDFDNFVNFHNLPNKPIIALLPGSRNHEIESLLPIMKSIVPHFRKYQFIIAGAPGKDINYYNKISGSGIHVLFRDTHNLIKHSNAAIVASGTATLETALLKTPQIVIYKMGMGWLLELFRKQILKTKYFSLVNLVAEKEVVKELFQSQVNTKNITLELHQILNNMAYRSKMINEYKRIEQMLASDGAAKQAAKNIVNILNN